MSQIETTEALSLSSAAPTTSQERSTARTRTSRAWGAMTFGLGTLVVVLVFALQNLDSVEVTFVSMHARLPLAVLLLLVAVVGAFIAYALGAARIVQLRVRARRLIRDRKSPDG